MLTDAAFNRLSILVRQLQGAVPKRGAGSPNGSVTGSPGDLYVSTTGGAGTTLYVKESGAGTNTGWVAK